MTIYPDKLKPTIVKWNVNGTQRCFDCTYKFSEAIVFFQLDLVVVFKKESSNQARSVACVYNMEGEYLYEILFPVLDSMNRHIVVSYMWSSEIKKGIKRLHLGALREISLRVGLITQIMA